ncbi:hypothetical protein QQZ08_010676 [Neonectria magnoliae]|uniref:Uncharacterized protein n=1 Tax=Neonectria magnoliae TaxID=2732573 RepID=A0ABR1HFW4_9HYPO
MESLKDLKPGEAQLLSYFKPGLVPGEYNIDVHQPVTGPDSPDPILLHTTKKFNVEGPSPYQLPAGSLHSVYPGQGEAVESRILSHVTLSDPHVPWELSPDNGAVSNDFLNGAPVPWLALLVFTADELKTLPSASPPLAPSPTLAVQLSKKQLQSLKTSPEEPKTQVPLSDNELSKNPDDTISTIFVNSAAFRAYFLSQTTGNPEKEPAIAQYSYLAHVRRSRSTQAQDPTTDSFGLVVNHRAGPLDINAPTTAYAHLVSLIGVRDQLRYPEQNSSDLTALVSLHSWTFSWVPNADAEIGNVIEKLSENVRPLAREFKKVATNDDMKWLKTRMESGYTFVKHRLPSGETTSALFRGPLIPHRPHGNELKNAEATGHGSGLQIIDSTTGLIDISYSTAWSLGRSLALDNSAFTIALSALRARITSLYKERSPPTTAGDAVVNPALQNLPEWVKQLQQATEEAKQSEDTKQPSVSGVGSRWRRSRDQTDSTRLFATIPSVDTEGGLDAIQKVLEKEVRTLIDDKNWYARELSEPTEEGLLMPKVLDFIYNGLLTLRDVPHNYLFPEPDILDTDAVLTFHVDPLWLDTLVDGALSIGNHSTVNEDITRKEIKRAINTYLAAVEVQDKQPRIPCWGAVLCGRLLRSFGDPRIRTGDSTASSPQLLTSIRLHDRALLLNFNCRPEDLPHGLTISQPPHQQRFAAGTNLMEGFIRIDCPAVPSEDAPRDVEKFSVVSIGQGRDSSYVFDFGTRCLQPSRIMDQYINGVKGRNGSFPPTGSAALMSLVLGDRLQELTVKPTEDQLDAGRAKPLEPFQLNVKASKERAGLAQWSTETKDSMAIASGQVLKFSAGSVPLEQRPLSTTETFATTKASPIQSISERGVPDVSKAASLQDTAPSGQLGSLTTSCRVLNQHSIEDGTRTVDLLVVIKTGQDGKLNDTRSGIQLRGVRVCFPLVTLMDPDSIAQPTVTLLGNGSTRWVAGSGYDASTGSEAAFVVKLGPRSATSVKQVDFGFLLSNITLSSGISDDVLIEVKEEYAVEDGESNGESKKRVVTGTCLIDNLKMT